MSLLLVKPVVFHVGPHGMGPGSSLWVVAKGHSLYLVSTTMAATPSIKRKKKNHGTLPSEKTKPLCYFFYLPIELIAEVVSYLTSPAELLALTRTCKRLCNLLVNPNTKFMWKAARERFDPPVPEPLPWQTESSLAAILFGPTRCPFCQKLFVDPPQSIFPEFTSCPVC